MFAALAAAFFFVLPSAAAEPAVLDLHAILGSEYACSVPRAIQFLAEDELVLLAGPTSDCVASVDSLEIVAISLEGRLIARRPWTSTEAGLVLPPARLVLPEPAGALILDQDLKTVQTLRLAKRGGSPDIRATDTGILSLTFAGRPHTYFGTPLAELLPPPADPDEEGEIVSTMDGSWQLRRNGSTLLETRRGSRPKTLADLSWVTPPCESRGVCQTDATSLHFQTVLGKRNRIVITSRGTEVPLTSAFGLVSWFRAEVFDLDSGAEVFREEDFLRTGERAVVLSPDGDRLVSSDGLSASVHVLN